MVSQPGVPVDRVSSEAIERHEKQQVKWDGPFLDSIGPDSAH